MFNDPTAQGGNGRAFATGANFQVTTVTGVKLVQFVSEGKQQTLYIDPNTGAILGKLAFVDRVGAPVVAAPGFLRAQAPT